MMRVMWVSPPTRRGATDCSTHGGAEQRAGLCGWPRRDCFPPCMFYAQLHQAITDRPERSKGATVAPTVRERAVRRADEMAAKAAVLRIEVHQTAAGARLLDCGVKAEGGLRAGLGVARVCLAGLSDVALVPGGIGDLAAPLVQ